VIGVADPLKGEVPCGFDAEDDEDLEEAPENEVEAAEEKILDQATAARSIAELRTEIETLKRLEALALSIRRSGEDKKWRELANLLGVRAAHRETGYSSDRQADKRSKQEPSQATQSASGHCDQRRVSHETRISWQIPSPIAEIARRHEHQRKCNPHAMPDSNAEAFAHTGKERKIAGILERGGWSQNF
jgi:hypothetical protein